MNMKKQQRTLMNTKFEPLDEMNKIDETPS